MRTALWNDQRRAGVRVRQASMDKAQEPTQARLFTVRLWREELGAGRREWRGEVHDVVSGERRYFREWSALITSLRALLQAQEPDGSQGDSPSEPE
jgi:hypothetical protein